MGNRYFSYEKPWFILVVILLVLSTSACRHHRVNGHGDDARYVQIDSMLSSMTDPDSLAAIARQSNEQNDVMSEMLALKYQGKRLRSLSRFDEAVEAHNRCLELATEMNDTIEMIMAYDNLGTNYRRLGNLSTANGFHFKALRLCDAYSDQSSREALTAKVTTLNGIGNIEIELHNYAVADSVLRLSLEGEKELGRNVGIAINYSNLGSIKMAYGEIDSAWVYFKQSLEYNQLANSQLGVALCHLHFGELHEVDRRFSHALEEYKLAYDMMQDLGDRWHWLDACLALASVSIKLGEQQDARRYLQEADTAIVNTGSREHQVTAYNIHYELASLEGNATQALQYYIRGNELLDSICGLEKSDEMRSQRTDYEHNRKSGEMDVLNRDLVNLKHARNMQVLFGMLLLLMALMIIAALVYAMRVRNRTQRLMRQVEETRSLFFTNVVHQLRTPLTAIMGAIDGILAMAGEEKDKAVDGNTLADNARLIERQGKNLLHYVDRILKVGSVRSAITDPDWRMVDGVTFIRMIVESYRDRCLERQIELSYAPRESSVMIDAVPNYLNTIVSSLLDNAINYSYDLGRIVVTTHVNDGEFIIRVADSGMGISKNDLPHVFEPFFRSDEAEQLVEGVGIGLTVVRDMAMAMGGSVAADSAKDQGAVFTVKLPCKHGDGVKQQFDKALAPITRRMRKPQVQTGEIAQEQEQDDGGSDGRQVVLVVEDHVDVAHLVGRVLSDDYKVQYAFNGEQGLARAQSLNPDLIITDVKMPLMDGIELCRHLRQSQQVCHIPIIVLSARNSDADRIRGIEAGADAYLVKPFVNDELRAWVKHLLEMRQVLKEVYTMPPAVTQNGNSQPQATTSSEEDKRFLDKLAQELDNKFADGSKIDLDMIALTFKMGESQLRRKVQALTGKNMLAYVSQIRMEKAMRLLRQNPDMLIGDVAEQCGFADVAYFSRVFRQHYGMTPTQARKTVG